MIDDDGSADEDLIGGVVRDVVGRGVRRDVVSISGSGGHGRRIRDVLVENVRCYESALRGAVEVSDGTDNITVRKIYAESAVCAIDGNVATVRDGIHGERAIISGNLP